MSLLLHVLEIGNVQTDTSNCTCEIIAHRKIAASSPNGTIHPSSSSSAAAGAKTSMSLSSPTTSHIQQVVDVSTIPSTARSVSNNVNGTTSAINGAIISPISINDLDIQQSESDYVEIHVTYQSGETLGRVTIPITQEKMLESEEVWNVWYALSSGNPDSDEFDLKEEEEDGNNNNITPILLDVSKNNHGSPAINGVTESGSSTVTTNENNSSNSNRSNLKLSTTQKLESAPKLHVLLQFLKVKTDALEQDFTLKALHLVNAGLERLMLTLAQNADTPTDIKGQDSVIGENVINFNNNNIKTSDSKGSTGSIGYSGGNGSGSTIRAWSPSTIGENYNLNTSVLSQSQNRRNYSPDGPNLNNNNTRTMRGSSSGSNLHNKRDKSREPRSQNQGGGGNTNSSTGANTISTAATTISSNSGTNNANPQGPSNPSSNANTIIDQSSLDEYVQQRVGPYKRILEVQRQKEKLWSSQAQQVPELRTQLNSIEKKCEGLYRKCYSQASLYASDLAEARETIRVISQEREQLQKDSAQWKIELEVLQKREQQKQDEVNLAKNELETTKQKLTKYEDLQKDVLRWKEESGEKTALHLNLSQELETTKLKFQSEVQNSRVKEAALRIKIQELLRISEEESKEKANLENKVAEMSVRMKEKEAEVLVLKDEKDGLERETETLRIQATKFKDLLDRETTHRTQVEAKWAAHRNEQLAKLSNECTSFSKDLKDEVDKLKHDLSKTKCDLALVNEENDELKIKLASAQGELTDLQSSSQNWEEIFSYAKEASRRNGEMKESLYGSLEACEHQWKTWTEQYEICKHNVDESIKKKSESLREFGQMKEEACLLKKELNILKAENQNLKKELSTHHTIKEEVFGEIQGQLETSQNELTKHIANGDWLMKQVVHVSGKFKEAVELADKRIAEVERVLLRRNVEVKVLMHRIQELSSKYQPIKSDAVDVTLARYIHGYRPAVPFCRLGPGSYLFGSRHVLCKLVNEKPVFRIGGGFVSFEKFLEQFAAEELDRLLQLEDGKSWNTENNGALMLKMQQANKVQQELLQKAGVNTKGGPGIHNNIGAGAHNSAASRLGSPVGEIM